MIATEPNNKPNNKQNNNPATSWTEQLISQPASTHLPWLTQQRQDALAHFAKVGLPSVRDEQWRYTKLRALKSQALSLNPAKPSAPLTQPLPITTNPRLVFIDGHYSATHSTANRTSGVRIAALSEILDEPFIRAAFNTTLPNQPHGFSALNTAFAQDGYVLHLAQGQVLDTPLEVLFVNQNNQHISHTRNLIISEANTQCTIIERHIGDDATVYLNNSITEIVAGENAHIDHTKIQQESEQAFHIGGVFIQQAAGSNVANHNIALTGLLTRNDTHADLLGQGAHIAMNGLVLGQGRQHIDNHTQVNHSVANCTSDEYYKTILDHHSRSVFRGRIVVAQDAQLTVADQQNNNLLLSDTAEADTLPQLEIYADDVKCSHGATVGQLDAKSIFYLNSRGIDYQSARALLTFAFANQVIERIKVSAIRDELTQLIAGELLHINEELI